MLSFRKVKHGRMMIRVLSVVRRLTKLQLLISFGLVGLVSASTVYALSDGHVKSSAVLGVSSAPTSSVNKDIQANSTPNTQKTTKLQSNNTSVTSARLSSTIASAANKTSANSSSTSSTPTTQIVNVSNSTPNTQTQPVNCWVDYGSAQPKKPCPSSPPQSWYISKPTYTVNCHWVGHYDSTGINDCPPYSQVTLISASALDNRPQVITYCTFYYGDGSYRKVEQKEDDSASTVVFPDCAL